MTPLVIDVGGSHVKVCSRTELEPIQFDSSPHLTPATLVKRFKQQTKGWKYDRISLGVPAKVMNGKVVDEPGNLGHGWRRFDYAKAFGVPVRVINDAAMQALGAYDGGRMLFLGFGTGVGSAIVTQSVVVPLELGDLVVNRKTLFERLGREAFERDGLKRWRRNVIDIAKMLKPAFDADYIVIGGGKAGDGLLGKLPEGLRAGGNEDAFTGGFRLWEEIVEPHDQKPADVWRVLH